MQNKKSKSRTLSLRQQHFKQYQCWINMLHRCHNPRSALYPEYGGRGISVCDRWRHYKNGFANFLADMPNRQDDQSIERVDNDQGYSQANCIWADRKTQQLNRRKPVFKKLDFGHGHDKHGNPNIEFNGDIKSLPEWATLMNMERKTLRTRLVRGMSISDALNTPVGQVKNGPRVKVLPQITLH